MIECLWWTVLFLGCVTALKDDRIFFRSDWGAIVGGQEAAAPIEDDPVVFVLKEDHWARVGGRRDGKFPNSYYRFLGLRYAEPPVGHLRFQRPRRLPLTGDISAFKFGAHCPQPNPDAPNTVTGSEDCLFLNIFTPRLPDGGKLLPVLFWIHGGGYRRGSASQYGGGYLTRRDLVVVTVQYRLGSLGFLSTGQQELPGNSAMFDQAAALAWAKDYIEFFGGDPNLITVAGQGTGASSASLLAISNVTQGRMNGVIAMSGAATSPFALDNEPGETASALAKENGCPMSPPLRMVKCLQQLPIDHLISSDSALEKLRMGAKALLGLESILTPAPVTERSDDRRALPPYLDEKPAVALDNQHFTPVRLLMGVTKHETAGAVTGGLKNTLLDGLKNIPQFFEQVLVKDLVQETTKGLKSAVSSSKNVFNFLSANYKGIKPKTIADALNQVIEATTDALFNFPAYRQSSAWTSGRARSYFYSFEHKGLLRGAEKLFKGSILVDDSQDEELKAVTHGSDLPYLFDIRSLDGTPDPEFNESTALRPDDQAVRDNFLNIFSMFVTDNWSQKPSPFPSYLSITPKWEWKPSFRDCQMSLWSGKKPKNPCPSLDLITSKITQGLGDLYAGTGSILGGKLPTFTQPNSSKLNLGIPGLG